MRKIKLRYSQPVAAGKEQDRQAAAGREKARCLQLAFHIRCSLIQVFSVGLILLMLALLVFLFAGRAHQDQALVAGFRLYTVVSGSMAPAVPAGSLIVVQPVDTAHLATDDIILFQNPQKNRLPTLHRIVAIDHSNETLITTRGDANRVNDPGAVTAAMIQGKLSLHIPLLGKVIQFAQTRRGLVFLVFLPAILIILLELAEVFRIIRLRRKNSCR